jgi:hypothetical protein
MSQTDVPENFPPNHPTEESARASAGGDDIVAQPEVGYRWKHLIMSILMIAGGMWFAYDGWINWPKMNVDAARVEKQLERAQHDKDDKKAAELSAELRKYEKHNDASILLQKILAFVLPGFGLFWGTWTIKDTRGQYRLAGDTLHVPGHPPVPFDHIRRIDKRKWDRKGIAYLHYEHGAPPTQRVLKLDDYAYERKPTDDILELIERNLLAPSAAASLPRTGGFPVINPNERARP